LASPDLSRADVRFFLRLLAVFSLIFVLAESLVALGVAPDSVRTAVAHAFPRNIWLAEAFFASYLLLLCGRADKKTIVSATAVGLVFGLALRRLFPASSVGQGIAEWLVGLGLSGAVVQTAFAWRAAPRNGTREWSPAILGVGCWLCIAAALFLVQLPSTLHPTTYDAGFYALSRVLDGGAGAALGRAVGASPLLRRAAQFFYFGWPLAFVLLCAHERRRRRALPVRLISSFMLLTASALTVHLLVPAVGPRGALGGLWPTPPPLPDRVAAGATYFYDIWRTGSLSLPVAWALLIFWCSREGAQWVRWVGGVFLAGVAASVLALGGAYPVGVVAAFPLTLAVWSGLATADVRRKLQGVAWGAGLTAAWLWLACTGAAAFAGRPAAVWLLAPATIGVVVWRHGKLAAPFDALAEPAESVPSARRAVALPRFLIGVAAVFFFSGFAGLVYQVVFAKAFALTFGSTARATVIVLTTYMSGLAIGTWAGGRLARRLRQPLRGYVAAEIGIGVWCASAPLLLRLARFGYVAVAHGAVPGQFWLTCLQLALGALVLAPPTLLMGLTMPLLTAKSLEYDPSLGRSVGLLYGMNTLGAAVGAFATGYALLPAFGVTRTTQGAVAINFLVAFVAHRLGKRADAAAPRADHPAAAGDDSPVRAGRPVFTPPAAARMGAIGTVVLCVGGFVAFGLEIVFTHLLAVVAGNSTYAFSLMLFCFLIGLGAGSFAARRLLGAGADVRPTLCFVEIGMAAAVLAGTYLWDKIPGYFATFHDYPSAAGFGAREFIRFVVCCTAMIPPAFFVGASYVTAMEWVGIGAGERPIPAMARAGALNTAANIAGALAVGFALLPAFGSLKTLQAMTGLIVSLALLTLLAIPGRRKLVPALAAMAAVAAHLLQPSAFHWESLCNGANIYFQDERFFNKIIDHAESLDGGLTAVALTNRSERPPVLTLLTNAKFQGDNSDQMRAQYSFGLMPQLHTRGRDRALAIGLGTGVSLRMLHDGGFRRVDAVDLSADIIRMSRRWFADINGGVYEKENVRAYVADGRNFLLLRDETYDLIGIEISSIWFAGCASLYNREFYQLVKQRLGPHGVLQQWVQLHRLTEWDLLSVLATVHAELPEVWLYFSGGQGVIVACRSGCPPLAAAADDLDSRAELQPILAWFGGSARNLSNYLLMDREETERYFAYYRNRGIRVEDCISTDDNLHLEYSTPRSNVRDLQATMAENFTRFEKIIELKP